MGDNDRRISDRKNEPRASARAEVRSSTSLQSLFDQPLIRNIVGCFNAVKNRMSARAEARGSVSAYFRLLIIFFAFVMHAMSLASPGDTTADAALGQTNLVSNEPDDPALPPTEASLNLDCFFCSPTIAVGTSGRLYVADGNNGRVLGWPSAASFQNGDPADVVVGQPDFVSDNCSSNGGASATCMFFPQGVTVDDLGNLWVTDAFAHRVLRFSHPVATGDVATLVLGQADFSSAGENQGLGELVARADTMSFPGRVLARGNDIWVADSGNSRVLHFTNPTTNGASADRVFGQFGDFTTPFKNNNGSGTCVDENNACGPPSANNLFNPIGIAIGVDGALFVADWANSRVLRYDNPLASDTTADAVYGQPNFTSDSPNNGGTMNGLNNPNDVSVDAFGKLIVADSANHRLVVYNIPLDSALPSRTVGQLDNGSANNPNHGLAGDATDADGLWGPTGVAFDAFHNMYIADTTNNRVLRFDTPIIPDILGDADGDADVDETDFAFVVDCFFGPNQTVPSPECDLSLLDQDDDVDLKDMAQLIRCFSGQGVVGDPKCAR